MIHHTVGLYPNGETKSNGVPSEDLAAHIQYNITFRPGRALFVDGFCIYRGLGVRPELLEKYEGAKATMTRDTQPYV